MIDDMGRAYEILHQLWTRATPGATYNKRDWQAVERIITSKDPFNAEAVMAFERLLKVAQQGPPFDEPAWRELAITLRLEKHLVHGPSSR